MPIHGWVYEPQKSRYRKSAFAQVLASKYNLVVSSDNQDNFDTRVNLLIADNERGKAITITIGEHHYTLPVSLANGHFETVLVIPTVDLDVSQKNIEFYARLPQADTRIFMGEFSLIQPLGKSVISDIDDTVKVSHVTNRKALLENTFFNDFTAVDGMPVLYQKLHQRGYEFHFVSSSPWHLYTPLQQFLEKYKFPWATLHLKKIRFKDSTLLDLFKKGTKTKPIVIEKLLQAYPKRSFLLVGDSGEQDAEFYAAIARQYSQQIERILIRSIDTEVVDMKKYHAIFKGVDIPWQIFSSVDELVL